MLPNISRSKVNLAIKIGQEQNITKKKFFSENYAENEAGRLVPGLFLFLKVLYEARCLHEFQYFSIVLNLAYNKNKLYKTLDY